MLIDTHFHLVNEDYNVDDVLNNARRVGVKYFVVSGSDFEDNVLNRELLGLYDDVFLSVGFHPCVADNFTEDKINILRDIINSSDRVVAIGEIGLDYFYGKDNRENQIKLFRKQLDLATEYNLPVVIHTRDAFLDTYNILKEYNLSGVIHCFSGSLETAKQFIDLGYYLGIGGVVTFKNSNLKDVVKAIGLDSIVLETDSPYLSPLRGKKNEPANLKYISEYLAELFEISVEEVEKITSNNALSLFDLNVDLC